MSFLKKIQERIIPLQTSASVPLIQVDESIKHEFVNFSNTSRIGIICYFSDPELQDNISEYKKKLEKLGYECEVLIFIDQKEKQHNIYLQSFSWEDLDRRSMMPYSPRTDRFIKKRYDLLLNLYLHPCPQLLFISNVSHARCRVGAYLDHFKPCTDLLIPVDQQESISGLISKINNTLNLQAHERKQI